MEITEKGDAQIRQKEDKRVNRSKRDFLSEFFVNHAIRYYFRKKR